MKHRKKASGRITLVLCATVGLASVMAAFFVLRAQPAAAPPAEIGRASAAEGELFPRGIRAVGTIAPSDAETVLLGQALREGVAGLRTKDVAARVEEFLAAFPGSAYRPSLETELGVWYRRNGRFSKSLEHWRSAWRLCAQYGDGEGKWVGDRALAHLASLLASLGRLEELEPLVALYGRVFVEPGVAQLFIRSVEAARHMRNTPGIAYRCGPFAVNNLVYRSQGFRIPAITEMASPPAGFSLAQLAEIAAKFDLGLVPAFRGEGADFLVPSVVHWKENHYAAIVAEEDGNFLVEDPTFLHPVWMDAETLSAEASGYFLIPANDIPPGWRLVEGAEAGAVFGKGYPESMDDDGGPSCVGDCCEEGGGGSGTGSGTNSCGMASWKVVEPNINLEITDIPMLYNAAIGPDFVLNTTWRQRTGEIFSSDQKNHSHLSDGWNSDLFSFIYAYPGMFLGTGEATFTLYWGNGFLYKLHFASGATVSDLEYASGLWAKRTVVGSTVTALDVYTRNGSVEHYSAMTGTYHYRLDSRADATGQTLTFTYDDPYGSGWTSRVTRITTADNAQFNFSYGDAYDAYRVTGVTGPNSRSMAFGYSVISGSTNLTSMTDAVGLVSSVEYDPMNWWVTRLVTPYGTNTFTHASPSCGDHNLECAGIDRSIIVDEPGGTRQVYAFYDNPYTDLGSASELAGKIPSSFPAGSIPSYGVSDPPLQTLDTIRDQRNSHYWGRQQAAALSTTNLASLTAGDYRLSRTRHWLRYQESPWAVQTLSWELAPSPDGSNEVLPVFYDYAGKDPALGTYSPGTYKTYTGTSSIPSVVSQVMPDGTYRYKYFQRNALGMKTSEIERWVQNGAVTYRSNLFTYASGTSKAWVDNLLMVRQVGPYGETILGRSLHGSYNDQIGSETNAVGEVTTFNYNTNRLLTSKTTHAGLVSTYAYDSSSYRLTNVTDSISGVPLRTNSYTWLNGYMRTHTDPRGFRRTFDYDFLGRLTQVTYPDATTETFGYALPAGVGFNASGSSLAILDLVTYKDRLGNYSRSLPNRIRQIEKVIEPSVTTVGQFGTETTIAYCSCGSPSSVTRGSNTTAPETTSFTYNYQGSAKTVTLPNSTSYTNLFDSIGRALVRQDGLMNLTNVYDNLSRVVARKNGAGLVEGSGYDLRDRIVMATNVNGVILTNQYDGMNRVLVRGYPDGGKEYWYYRAGFSQATRYTNQAGNIVTWNYDAAERLTNEIGAGVYTNSFTYAPGGDLRTLTDGKGQVTAWAYDAEGRVSSKTNQANAKVLTYGYDASNRLTNRWSAAKGTTTYKYDGAGNLTNVVYPVSTAITYKYSALNRLTNMVDAAGTTKFTYNTAGDLASEDGPWGSDVISYGYHATVPHLRTSVSLQQPSGSWSQTFGYDAAERLQTVGAPAGTFTYTYSTGVGSAASASVLWKRLDQLVNKTYVTNAFDSSGRLTDTWLKNNTHGILNQHSYLYNTASQRTKQTRTDSSYVNYTYDPIGQLQSALGYTSGGTPLATEQNGYTYDAAWNLKARTNNAVVTSFGVNVKNELTTEPNGTAVYDSSGNLTSDGVRNFAYDDENQLTSAYVNSSWKADFQYDGLSRMRKRIEYSWSGAAWTPTSETRYVYDGRRVIQERNSSDVPQVAYTRGNDLSGSFEGAGGIGGLLSRASGYSAGSWSTHNHYHADGGGNITALVDSGTQLVTASYRYNAYGNLLSSSGTMASANTYRFSSKEIIASAGIYYYGFRFYEPNFQRWLNQDPIGENGGFNLYGFVGNNPLRYVDPYGHEWYDWEWIDTAANFGAGLGDGVSFGLTGYARDLLGINQVDPCSGWYRGGYIGGTALGFAVPSGGAAKLAGGADRVLIGSSRSGIYRFAGRTGRGYVGQSSNVGRRLARHGRTGKLPLGSKPATWEVRGGRLARERAEQQMINREGLPNLENVVNPLGGRPHLYHYVPTTGEAALAGGAAGAGGGFFGGGCK